VLALAAPAAARADGLGLQRVTTGPSGGNEDVFTDMLVSSGDGTRALFGTDEALTFDDDRPGGDYYERVGNTTRLLAHDTGTDDPRIATGFYFASADATRIVIAGGGHWTAGDTDDMFSDDVYTAKDGVVEWVSQGPMGGNADSFSAEPTAMSGDGNRIVFRTPEKLIAGGTDAQFDLYVRGTGADREGHAGQRRVRAQVLGRLQRRRHGRVHHPGAPDGRRHRRARGRLPRVGRRHRARVYRAAGRNSADHPVGSEPNAIGGDVLFMSDDGTCVVFNTFEQLTPDDTDHQSDSYLWTPSGVQKVTPGDGEYDPTAGSCSRRCSVARRTARTSSS
jgi:hypothetical protein